MTYIALDIESTGFDTSLDHVIEIAAIKFDGEKIIDRFETLLNPGIKIPPIISHITGIKDQDVVNAPVFSEIEKKLGEFLGNYPIVGHNIDFDVNFLKAKGLPLTNPLFDTLQLATILLPGLPSYSLDTLGRLLKLQHQNKHRAMADTVACHKLFLILEEKVCQIDQQTAEIIHGLVDKSNWGLKELFLAHTQNSKTKKQKTPLASTPKASKPFSETLVYNDPTELLNELDGHGKLQEMLPHHEPRANQKKMAATILEALEKDQKMIIEAGTGIGKTLAYLLSTIYWSLKTQVKIVISTHTHNLQEQILKKDIPILEKLFATTESKTEAHTQTRLGETEQNTTHGAKRSEPTQQAGFVEQNTTHGAKRSEPTQQAGFVEQKSLPFETALMKGRSNYLSGHRLELALEKEKFEDHEISALIKILLWRQKTESGDLEELTFIGKEQSLLEEICCSEYVCPHDDPIFKNNCFLIKARQKAMNANIIIVNHALLLQDCFGDTPILPEYQYLIIDEAHQLEQVATDSLSMHLSLFQFQKPFEKLKKYINGLLSQPESFFQKSIDKNQLHGIKEKLESIHSRIDIFFGLMGIFYEKNLRPLTQQSGVSLSNNRVLPTGKTPYENQYEVNLQKSDLESMEWQHIQESGYSIISMGKEMVTNLEKSQTEKELRDRHLNSQKTYSSAIQKNIMELEAMLKNQGTPTEHISWIYKNAQENVGIRQSPLNVSEPLNQKLFSKKQSIILTSATLRTNHSFEFIRNQLGLGPEFGEMALASHFSYPEQVKILIPEDLPEPLTEGYFMNCCEIIAKIIKKNQGRTLVLFTAKKALGATYHQIAPQLKEEGFTILAQNFTGGRGKIIEHFKDEPQSCAIFGTNSFWEGVDLQGNQLNCVIIQKLPFDPPTDPIIAARSKKFIDPFNEYQLPRAILRFKQGFGRLIRSSRDTGSIVILDNRIIQKSYGRSFLEALPEGIKIEYGTKDNLEKLL